MTSLKGITSGNLISALHIFTEADSELHFYLDWREEETPYPLVVSVDCSDDYIWGCADFEDLTNADMPLLRRCYLDAKELVGDLSLTTYGFPLGSLFCARKRKLYPTNLLNHFGFSYWPEEIRQGWIKLLEEAPNFELVREVGSV